MLGKQLSQTEPLFSTRSIQLQMNMDPVYTGAGLPGFDSESPGFNYEFDTFIQDQDLDLDLDLDMDYLAEESSGSGSGSSKTMSDGGSQSNYPMPRAPSSSASAPTPTSRPQPALAPAVAPPSSSGSGIRPSMYTSEILARGRDLASVGLRLQSPPLTAGPLGKTSAAMLSSKQRVERRGHTKSRRGCFNCKRRRIKCQETRPACGHCIKTGLNCEYPVVPQVVHQPQHQIPIFSLQDMRLFQHFLLQCYPHYPIGSENIWTHEIPCLSQKYEYLMHAILGFAASELLDKDPTLIESAMNHRLKAIRAIKKTLNAAAASGTNPAAASASSDKTFEEGNALMATCFALTFQSVWLDDGMTEYMTFIRGIVIVAYQMYMRGSKFLFGAYLGDKQKEVLEPFMKQVGLINPEWARGAVNGIQGLGELVFSDDISTASPGTTITTTLTGDASPDDTASTSTSTIPVGVPERTWISDELNRQENKELLQKLQQEEAAKKEPTPPPPPPPTTGPNQTPEQKYYELILDMAQKCLTSSWEAYQALTAHYAWWMMLPHEQFERLMDPSNQVAILLASHWIALKQIMAPITEVEKRGFAKVPDSWKDSSASGPSVRQEGDASNRESAKKAQQAKHDMDVGIIRWLKFSNRSVEGRYRKYNAWPEWVEEQLDRDLSVFGRGSVKCC